MDNLNNRIDAKQKKLQELINSTLQCLLQCLID